ncbi:MAG TPA: DUF1833 family protein [Accumulibacter sp.]|uniref:DUF1833 family protein n=1 Tax=Accumulibacter sp. TaxID=2053492 RepID=UPI0025D9B034|nr:DUF1833 family protein [Accumulibacter sp.]MCM8664090.1 DUF1833 domain-containing protein [Accumulibacter sp.]HNC51255.1 DUF1833 family protein [Accumulibacter sp.]
MARAYSSAYRSTLAQTSAPEAPVVLLQIDHPALSAPVRVVNDTVDLTSNGSLYVAFPFDCQLPDDFEGQLPRASLVIDNVGRDLMYWIETSGGGQGSTATFSQVMRSRPDVVEWSILMYLYNVTADARHVSAELGFANFFGRPAVQLNFRPDSAPGIF